MLNEINNLVKRMIMWLIFITPFIVSKCANKLNVICYLTSFKKELPLSNVEVMDSNNVNTAFTYHCPNDGEITIFRKEEIFKVFIHESFHVFWIRLVCWKYT